MAGAEQLTPALCTMYTNLLGLIGLRYGILRQALLNQDANRLGKKKHLKARVIHLRLDASHRQSMGKGANVLS